MKYEIHFQVSCKECGRNLKAEMNWRHNVIVEPCPNCMKPPEERKEYLHNAIGELKGELDDRGNN